MEPKYFEALYPDMARFEEIERVVAYVKEGNSCQVIGLPGVGRSNLLGLLAYNRGIRQKHFEEYKDYSHSVPINFTELRNRPLIDVMKLFFLSLVDSLRERKREEEYAFTNQIFRESLSFQDELVLFQGLKRAIEYLALERKYTVVFLLDQFDAYIPTVTADFFANLRVLRNRTKYRFSVIFSVNKPLEDVLEPMQMMDFYEFVAGHIVPLALYDKPSVDFRLGYLEKLTGKTIDDHIKDEIIRLTGGHGRMVRLCAEAYLAQSNNVILVSDKGAQPESQASNVSRSWPSQDDNRNLAEFFFQQRTVHGSLVAIWKSLSPSEQTYLLEGKSGVEDVESVTRSLEQVGLWKKEEIQIPLFKQFIENEKAGQEPQDDHIVFDMATNTIKKGDILLSEQLTAAEFRLLSYLLENNEQIVDREKIVDVVWQQTASTAGVTDQAVDQLIFRLRKKIEDDPNNPQHLQTIKGRGFKFVA